jgi:tRNA modification GTPase
MKPLPRDEATAFAWLTPPGTAAIATLALRGPSAWSIIRELFRPRSGDALPDSPPPHPSRLWLGWLGGPGPGERDEVVLALKRGGNAPCVEVHCHGGRQVARLLEELFRRRGVVDCGWRELEEGTVSQDRQGEALAALIQAPTVRTAAILLDQYQGALVRVMAQVQAALARQDMTEARRLLDELSRVTPLGRHLTVPWRVAILGAPNVGKSSLANRLAGFQRSIVSPVPGTTRDVVASHTAIDGWPVELIDTAGWRTASEALERQGIELAGQAGASADVCLWVLDASSPPQWPQTPWAELHLVINKMDLPAAWDLGQAAGAVQVSALTGRGVSELLEALSGWLVPQPPRAGAAVPFTPAQYEWIEQIRQHCAGGQAAEALRLLHEGPATLPPERIARETVSI